jgi:menaquinone-specific isochorismate synthase
VSTRITTEILGELPKLSEIATSSPLSTSWIRGGDGLIGFGKYKTHTVVGEKRFSEAAQWWRNELSQLEIHNNVHGSGTGPILFTSFSFLETEESELVIPEIVIGRKGEKSWITWIGNSQQPEISSQVLEEQSLSLSWGAGSVSEDEWKNRISRVVERIKKGELEKVVLARDISAISDQAIDLQTLLQRLESEYPSTWVFLVENLVGATPELLVRLSKSLVTSRVLAGTIRKTGDEEKDLMLAATLAKSSKDLEEHEYAVRSVADALSPFCSSTNVPESPFVLHLSNVMHLATDVTGVVNDSATPVNMFTVIKALHPSAAVCGTPTDDARTVINEVEGMKRGRYAGPVGWIDARGDGEVGIALRCGKLSSDLRTMRLFAGCGVVAGSNPEEELAESQAKLLPMRTALTTL